ncbi:MAG: hypothetical protein M3N08_05185 [Pseudomonadota bacterium]|nr:hypothetical protein [Pseudomonadota bacterium]
MGKTNMFTLLTVVVVQFVLGYLWYTHLFSDVVTVGGHSIDFLKLDIVSILLVIFGSYGLTYILGMLHKLTGTKDVGTGIKLGLTVGTFAIGLPIVMMLNLMGFTKIVLLVVFTHVVIMTILTNIVVIKLKKA